MTTKPMMTTEMMMTIKTATTLLKHRRQRGRHHSIITYNDATHSTHYKSSTAHDPIHSNQRQGVVGGMDRRVNVVAQRLTKCRPATTPLRPTPPHPTETEKGERKQGRERT